MSDRRGVFVAISGLVTAAAMGVALAVGGWQTSRDHDVLLRWYELHAGALAWRALAVAVTAAAIVAFAASFRERTWAVVPDHLWAGTVMVLAALGYAALTSVAAAVDVALLSALRSSPDASPELISFAASLHRSLLALATPALIVVMLGTVVPLLRWGTVGRITAGAALAVALLLTNPVTWELGRDVAAAWFLLVGAVVLFGRPSTAPLLVEWADDPAARAQPDDGPTPRR